MANFIHSHKYWDVLFGQHGTSLLFSVMILPECLQPVPPDQSVISIPWCMHGAVDRWFSSLCFLYFHVMVLIGNPHLVWVHWKIDDIERLKCQNNNFLTQSLRLDFRLDVWSIFYFYS